MVFTIKENNWAWPSRQFGQNFVEIKKIHLCVSNLILVMVVCVIKTLHNTDGSCAMAVWQSQMAESIIHCLCGHSKCQNSYRHSLPSFCWSLILQLCLLLHLVSPGLEYLCLGHVLLLELLCDKEQPGSALCVRAVNLGTVLEHVALVFLFALAAMAVNAGFDTA